MAGPGLGPVEPLRQRSRTCWNELGFVRKPNDLRENEPVYERLQTRSFVSIASPEVYILGLILFLLTLISTPVVPLDTSQIDSRPVCAVG